MPIRPFVLKGHERPITCVKFNRENDLLFTCARDYKCTVWWTDNGERLGTYNGHSGAIYECDVNSDSSRLLTGSADRTVKLWEVESGKELFSWSAASSVRSVGFAEGGTLMQYTQDNTFGQHPTIFLFNLIDDLKEQDTDPAAELRVEDSKDRINKVLWGPLNSTIISCGDDGFVRVWDTETQKQTSAVQVHKKAVNSIQFSKDKSMIITASSDQTAKIIDTRDLSLQKTFISDRPLNSAAVSPIANHIILGGGQEAMNVTTTSARAGHFETDFFHIIYCEYLGSVKGHFGPVNSLGFSTNGKMFASGSEDGYVRLHHFDKEIYAKQKD